MDKKKMQRLADLSGLVLVRNHLFSLLNGPRGSISKEDVPKIMSFVAEVDQKVVSEVLFEEPIGESASVTTEESVQPKKAHSKKGTPKNVPARKGSFKRSDSE